MTNMVERLVERLLEADIEILRISDHLPLDTPSIWLFGFHLYVCDDSSVVLLNLRDHTSYMDVDLDELINLIRGEYMIYTSLIKKISEQKGLEVIKPLDVAEAVFDFYFDHLIIPTLDEFKSSCRLVCVELNILLPEEKIMLFFYRQLIIENREVA